MKKFAALFTQSYRELFKVRTITTMAMFGAVSVLLGMYTIVVSDYLKIGFSSVPNELVYYLYGPVAGGVYGGVLDILKYITKPTGPFFPAFTVNAMLAGFIYGLFLYKKPLSIIRVLLVNFLVMLICNIGFGTFWISVLNGKSFLVLLPVRAVKNLIMWPVEALLFYSTAKLLEASGVLRGIERVKTK